MNNERAELKKVRAVSGPYYYTDGNNGKVLHLPTTLVENVKMVNDDGTEAINLKDIIASQFAMMELGLKKDICNLYVSTQGLHGNHIQLSGNASLMSVAEHRKNMTIEGEINPNLPYVQI